MNTKGRCGASFLILAGALSLVAQEEPPAKPSGKPTKGAAMDYGSYLASSLTMPVVGGKPKVVAYKSLDIKLGGGAYVSFDTELLRYGAGWTGEFLDLKKTHMTTSKGDVPPGVGGPVVFTTTAVAPGVSHGGSLADPRTD